MAATQSQPESVRHPFRFSENGSTSPRLPAIQTQPIFDNTLPPENATSSSTKPGAAEEPKNRKASDQDDTKSEHRSASSASSEDVANVDIEKQESKKSQQNEDQEEEKDPNLVDFDGPDDPMNPMNWTNWKKWVYAFLLGMMTFGVTFASSVFSAAIMPTAEQFGVSPEVMVLGVSLFVIGFAVGPSVFGPLSELYGRKIPLFTGYTLFIIFQIPVGVAQNLQTIFLCRFFGGVFASAPLSIVGGTLNDFFDPVNRGLAVLVFSAATFIGPILGPIIGGFITQSYLGWRWTAWITMILTSFWGIITFFVLPESFAPVILQRKAKNLRYETKNWALHAKADEHKVDLKEIAEKYILRPFRMLAMEPILVLISLYVAFIYAILYLFFEVFPITFQEQRGLNLGVGALPFLSMGVGVGVGSLIVLWTTKTRIQRKYNEEGIIVPEDRLIPMIVGSFLLPIGLFWFAWTSNPGITIWPEIIAAVPIGAAIQLIFLQGLVYIIDVYKMYSNSALAANVFFRSLLGGGFPMFAMGFYHNLGVPWATSTLGFISVGLMPVPILFFIYGEKIRSYSRYVPN